MLFYVTAGNCNGTALGLPAVQTYLLLLLITSKVIDSRDSRSCRMSWFISCYLMVRPCGLGRIVGNWGGGGFISHDTENVIKDMYVYTDINLYCSVVFQRSVEMFRCEGRTVP